MLDNIQKNLEKDENKKSEELKFLEKLSFKHLETEFPDEQSLVLRKKWISSLSVSLVY